MNASHLLTSNYFRADAHQIGKGLPELLRHEAVQDEVDSGVDKRHQVNEVSHRVVALREKFGAVHRRQHAHDALKDAWGRSLFIRENHGSRRGNLGSYYYFTRFNIYIYMLYLSPSLSPSVPLSPPLLISLLLSLSSLPPPLD